MTTFKTLCIAGITALILPLGAATPASAQEALVKFDGIRSPFERSDAACSMIVDGKSGCMGILKSMALGDVAAKFNTSVSQLIMLNQKAWAGEVNEKTQVPALLRFRFTGQSDQEQL